MDRFIELNVFVAVAEEQSFVGAARRLQMSPPPVTRAVNALEQRLGVQLLTRTTRHVRMTDAGKTYLQSARRILSDLSTADETAVGVHAAPSGNLSITAPLMFGSLHVVPCVTEYLERYPDTTVSVALLDRVVNLMEEGFDAGIRIGDLPDSSMRAVRIGSVRSVVCASPQYLQAHGTPKKPEQLPEHQIITTAGSAVATQWKFLHKGKSMSVRVTPRLSTSNIAGAVAAATAGFGITRLLSYQIEQGLRDKNLKLLLENYETASLPVHIVHQEGRVVPSKLRALIDVMVERLRANKLLNP